MSTFEINRNGVTTVYEVGGEVGQALDAAEAEIAKLRADVARLQGELEAARVRAGGWQTEYNASRAERDALAARLQQAEGLLRRWSPTRGISPLSDPELCEETAAFLAPSPPATPAPAVVAPEPPPCDHRPARKGECLPCSMLAKSAAHSLGPVTCATWCGHGVFDVMNLRPLPEHWPDAVRVRTYCSSACRRAGLPLHPAGAVPVEAVGRPLGPDSPFTPGQAVIASAAPDLKP